MPSVYSQLKSIGLTNSDAPTFQDLQRHTVKSLPYCYSLKCTKDKTGLTGVLKDSKIDTCPDCGDYMVWEQTKY